PPVFNQIGPASGNPDESPSTGLGISGTDHFTARYGVTGSDDELAIGTIDVGDAKGITARLGTLVRGQLANITAVEAA
ncbi:MAG: hypothetical protein WB902_21070, partial [Acetobacteraceae bacterium]